MHFPNRMSRDVDGVEDRAHRISRERSFLRCQRNTRIASELETMNEQVKEALKRFEVSLLLEC